MRLFLAFLLVLLPIALYLAYLALRGKQVGGTDFWQSGPVFWSALAGVVLMIGALAAWALTSGSPPDSRYVPERYVDGELVEGHFEQPGQDEAPLGPPDADGAGAPATP